MRCVDLSSDVHMDQVIVAINYWDCYLTTQIVLPLTRFQINQHVKYLSKHIAIWKGYLGFNYDVQFIFECKDVSMGNACPTKTLIIWWKRENCH